MSFVPPLPILGPGFGQVKLPVDERLAETAGILWEYFYSGFRTEVVDPLGQAEVREFNRFGRNTRHVDQAGFVNENEYDSQQRLKRTTTAEGSSLEYEYDANHNVVQITANPKPGSPLAPIVQSFLYDQTWNKVVQSTDALGRVTDFILDPANGNLDEIREPSVGGVRPTTFFTYNADGQVLTAADPEGKVTSNSYDPATADLLTVTEDDGILNLTTVFGYDAVASPSAASSPPTPSATPTASTSIPTQPTRRSTSSTRQGSRVSLQHRDLRD